jgi:membrane protease YdiL (CAAX protease family)
LITLGVGLNNLATTLVEGAEEASSRGVPPLGLWTQSVLMVALAAVGVGWPVRRTLGDTLARLGLEPISLRQVGIGLGLGIVVAPLMLLAMALVERVGIQPDADVEALNEALLGPLMTSPLGILTIGFAAGIGEETLLRGAVQPRFGLWLTAALFAILHSNYGVSLSTLIVFILGLGLGLVRIRYNTTTSILVHAAYNVTLSVILVFASSYLEV